MSILIVILVAISLSMDAFSLSLAYGTLGIDKNKIIFVSLIVGLYHFFMPILGMIVGKKIINLLPISPSTFVFIVLFLIGIEMIIESFKEEHVIKILKFFEILLFGFAVSIDSFSVGLGLKTIYDNPYISAFIFALASASFTYLGMLLGKKIKKLFGRLATVIGGLVLIIIGLMYLI